MNQDKKVPKLRFPEFSGEWEEKKLKELADVYDGVHQTPEYKESGIMFLSVENISTLKSNKFISEEAFKKNYKVFPEKGDIFMTRIGDIGTPHIVETSEKIAYYVSLALLKLKSVYPYFLNYALQSPSTQYSLKKHSLSTAIPMKINKEEIGEVDTFVSLHHDEQSKIGSFFANLDSIITHQQRKLESLKKLKKGLLQKMFPKKGQSVPELRFPGFSGEWEERKLGDLVTSLDYGLNAPAKDYDGKNKYLRITDIDDDSRNFIYSNLTSPDVHLEEAFGYLLNERDILFARTGATVGKTFIYKKEYGTVYFAGFLIRARINDNNDPRFIFQHTLTSSYNNFIKITSQRTGQPGVNAKEYASFNLYVPSLDEQQKIGSFFANLDNTINLQERKLDYLKKLKKGLLQQMFV